MRNLLSIILIFGILSAEPHQKAIQSANEIIRAFSEKVQNNIFQTTFEISPDMGIPCRVMFSGS